MIYFTSDWHFLHDRSFLYEPRGFSDIETMTKTLVNNFNEIVAAEDDVYVLGDCLLGGADNLDKGIDIMRWLHGKLHIIRGNHDSNKRWDAYKTLHNVVETKTAMFLKYNKYHFYLSHFPTLCGNYDDKGLKHSIINICGHTHTKDKFADINKGIIYHCEVDAHNNYPVSIEQIINDLKEYYKNNGEITYAD